MTYVFAEVITKLETVTVCPLVIVPLTWHSPEPMPAVPCKWHVALCLMRKCVGVAAAPPEAVPVHEPVIALTPAPAAAIQSDGRVSVASSVPVSAAAQLAGAEPE